MGWKGVEWYERQFFDDRIAGKTPIPCSDAEAWRQNPGWRFVYDKLELYRRLGQAAAPSGVEPPSDVPVVYRPIVNLDGMATATWLAPVGHASRTRSFPGFFWSVLYTGPQFSIDFAINDGRIVWWSVTRASASHTHIFGPGVFDCWLIGDEGSGAIEALAAARKAVEDLLTSRSGAYHGMANVEIIGDKVIEVHLRFSTQFASIYGPSVLEKIAQLYREGPGSSVRFTETPVGVSIPIWMSRNLGLLFDKAPVEIEADDGTVLVWCADVEHGIEECGPAHTYRLGYINSRGFENAQRLAMAVAMAWQMTMEERKAAGQEAGGEGQGGNAQDGISPEDGTDSGSDSQPQAQAKHPGQFDKLRKSKGTGRAVS